MRTLIEAVKDTIAEAVERGIVMSGVWGLERDLQAAERDRDAWAERATMAERDLVSARALNREHANQSRGAQDVIECAKQLMRARKKGGAALERDAAENLWTALSAWGAW